jgi:hypothetical protein
VGMCNLTRIRSVSRTFHRCRHDSHPSKIP